MDDFKRYNLRQRPSAAPEQINVFVPRKKLIVKNQPTKVANVKRVKMVHVDIPPTGNEQPDCVNQCQKDSIPTVDDMNNKDILDDLTIHNQFLKTVKESLSVAIASLEDSQMENDLLHKQVSSLCDEKTELLEKFKTMHSELQQIKIRHDEMLKTHGYMTNGVFKHKKHAWNFYDMLGLSANNADFIERTALQETAKKARSFSESLGLSRACSSLANARPDTRSW